MEAAVAASTQKPAGTRVADLRPGRRFEGRFGCLRKDRLTSRNGGSYLSVELRDPTGILPGRVVREGDRIGIVFEGGGAVRFRGKTEGFRGEIVAALGDVARL